MPITYSRFQSNGISDASIDTAFYILDAGYEAKSISLDSINPSNNVYTYNFSVNNFSGNKRADTDLSYYIDITTTTNLPFTYNLYLNETANKNGAKSIIISDVVEADEYGTYFKTMKTDYKTFIHSKNETNKYQLTILYPEDSALIDYQSMIEGINISIYSKQKIDNIQ